MYSKRPGTRKILAYYKAPFFERHPVCWWLYVGVLWLAAAVWRLIMFRTTFIALTGSVGKTTAKECLATILSEHAPTAKSKGTANWIAGVPLAILGVRRWHRSAVIEVGAARRGGLPEPRRPKGLRRDLRRQLPLEESCRDNRLQENRRDPTHCALGNQVPDGLAARP